MWARRNFGSWWGSGLERPRLHPKHKFLAYSPPFLKVVTLNLGAYIANFKNLIPC